jgi:ATP-dependent exoDNAse (exonuclease V) beta subunit
VAVSVELPKRRDQQDDDAEAMRKYYVAITRHEDHLVLIGTNTRSKDGLFAPGSFLDHMARRSFLSDALQALGPDQPAMDVAYGPAGRYIARCQCLAPEIVRRSPGRNVSPLQQALNECASAGQFADLVTDAVIPAHADWLGPLPATVGKVDLAVTALSEFVQCPQHYQWRHALRVPGHLLATPSDRPAMPMVDAATAGTYFHRCMELTDFVTPGPTDAVTIQAADEAGLSHAVASPLAAEFAEMRQRFEATDLWARLAAANRLLRELDFTIDLGPAVLRGQIDVLFLGADGRWGVVDYKSDRLAATHTDAIALHSRHHRQQMLIYALAAGRYLGVDALPATLYYLRPGVSHTFDFTPEDIQAGLAQLQSQALDLITARRTGHFAPQPGPACQWCDYRSLCRPAQ